MNIIQVWRNPKTIHYRFLMSDTARFSMSKEFYYHDSWLPDPQELINPRLIIEDYILGEITKKELIQEVVMLIITYQELKESGAWSSRVFSDKMRQLDIPLERVNISIFKLY